MFLLESFEGLDHLSGAKVLPTPKPIRPAKKQGHKRFQQEPFVPVETFKGLRNVPSQDELKVLY